MLKLGIIGMNEGNGHPYSYSAVFNGYNEKALQEECPLELVKIYLPKHHGNREFIPFARVTHIWTQDRQLSESVARVSNIPNVVDSMEDLIGKVDGVIFSRDDMWNHWEMAQVFLKAKMPIYMDKLMGHNLETMNDFINITGPDYPIFTASSFRFAPEVAKAKSALDIKKVKTIHAVSPSIWIRYAPHLLDAICSMFGYDIDTVQNIDSGNGDTVFIKYNNGLSVTVQVIENIALPIEFRCFSETGIEPYCVQYTDPTLESYFTSIYKMLEAFAVMVKEKDFSKAGFNESVLLNKLVVAGEISRDKGGRAVKFSEL